MVTATYDSRPVMRNARQGVTGLPAGPMIPPAERADTRALLPYGYTPKQVEELARRASWRFTGGLDEQDAYEAAWGGIIERLYNLEAGAPENDGHLVIYARTEIQLAGTYHRRAKGVPSHDPHGKPATARGFCRYWHDHLRHAPSPEALLVPPLTLEQIWPRLTPREQDALTALAEAGNSADAAAAMGFPRDGFNSLVSRARAHFFALWHEHETPSGLWRYDHRSTANGGSRPAHRPDCACITCGRRRQRLARENPAAAADVPVAASSVELARGWPLSELVAARRAELAMGANETGRRAAQLADAHGQPCAIRDARVISRIERDHRVYEPEDLQWLALALRLPFEQVQEAARRQAGMLEAERAARAHARAAQRLAALSQAPLPDGWPLADLIAGRRAELALSREKLARRMRKAAADHPDGRVRRVRTNTATLGAVERERCIPLPPTLHLLAVALDLPAEQVQAAAEAQRRKRQHQRATAAHAASGAPAPDAAGADREGRAA